MNFVNNKKKKNDNVHCVCQKKKKIKKKKKKKIEQLMKTMYSPLVGKWVDGRTAVCQREEFVSIGKLAEACHEGRIKSRDRTGQARSSD